MLIILYNIFYVLSIFFKKRVDLLENFWYNVIEKIGKEISMQEKKEEDEVIELVEETE